MSHRLSLSRRPSPRSYAARLVELRFLGRALHRRHRRLARRDRLRHGVEVAGADFALVLRRREAAFSAANSAPAADVRASSASRVAARQLEHRVVERVEAGQRDELELVAHRAELALELRDRRVVEVLLPVERRRAVVREQLARELLVDRLGERLRESSGPACRFRTRSDPRTARRRGRARSPGRGRFASVEAFGSCARR